MWNKEDQYWAVYKGWQCSPVYLECSIMLSFIFHGSRYGYHVRLLNHTHKHNCKSISVLHFRIVPTWPHALHKAMTYPRNMLRNVSNTHIHTARSFFQCNPTSCNNFHSHLLCISLQCFCSCSACFALILAFQMNMSRYFTVVLLIFP